MLVEYRHCELPRLYDETARPSKVEYTSKKRQKKRFENVDKNKLSPHSERDK